MNLGLFYNKLSIDTIIKSPEYSNYIQNFNKKLAPNLDMKKRDERGSKAQKLYKPLFDANNYTFLEEDFHYQNYVKKSLILKTIGKGLFVGIGYTHEIPSIKGQYINGFYFDYATGMPVIPGSSIKGVIRSAFPYTPEEFKNILKNKDKDTRFLYEEINQGKLKKLQELTDLNEKEIYKLKKEIFEYGDIFLDAYIVNAKGSIFDTETFAPQKDQFSHPVPLKFLKIKKEVQFKFRFLFKKDLKTLTVEKRHKLFEQIIRFNGIGAKVNENFGRF